MKRSKNTAPIPKSGDHAMRLSHHTVFRETGAFAGWPANYGLWSWGREVLSVFAVGKIGKQGQIHELDRHHPIRPCQARSLDGGPTWAPEPSEGSVPGGTSLSADEHLDDDLKVGPRLDPERDFHDLDRPIDFLDPETIVMCARTGLSKDPVGWFYVSRSRGDRWQGPFSFRRLDLPIAARTDIVPLGKHEAVFMLTTTKSDGSEGRAFSALTRDGGRHFEFGQFVGGEPRGYRIMPSTVIRANGRLVSAVRCGGKHAEPGWIKIYESDDHGRSWTPIGQAIANTGRGGNPGALLGLGDGRLVLVYGHREAPLGIRMTLSADEGRTWDGHRVLRADGGTPDLGRGDDLTV